jgi:hypothetical protein
MAVCWNAAKNVQTMKIVLISVIQLRRIHAALRLACEVKKTLSLVKAVTVAYLNQKWY